MYQYYYIVQISLFWIDNQQPANNNNINTNTFNSNNRNSSNSSYDRIHNNNNNNINDNSRNNNGIVIKISQDPTEVYTNVTYHSKKGYLYLLYTYDKECDKSNGNNGMNNKQRIQYLKIIQIHPPASNTSTNKN